MVRKLARNLSWQRLYVLMIDAGMPIFPGTLSELSPNQLNLLYWMRFYNQNIFSVEEIERPSEEIINYDCLLDEWLDQKKYKEGLKSRNVPFAEDMNDVIEF